MKLIQEPDGIILRKDNQNEWTCFSASSERSGVGEYRDEGNGMHSIFLKNHEIVMYISHLVFDDFYNEYADKKSFANKVLKLLRNLPKPESQKK